MPIISKKDVLCVVCSGGGHLAESLLAMETVSYPVFFVTYYLPHMKRSLGSKEHYFITNPHKNPFKYFTNLIESLRVYLLKRPRFILSTGSGMAIATCLIGRLCGSKVIFLESGARVHLLSLTGRFMYHFSDLFIVQWEGLLKDYPKARFGGLLI